MNEDDKKEILAEAGHYPQARAAAPEALKIVQGRFGWVDDEHLSQCAALLGMTPAELDGVATGYNLIYRRPVGRHVIHICDSVSCWIMGYENLLAVLLKELGIKQLGETTEDKRFTLLPIACLGACDKAPAMLIDGELHGNLTEAKLAEILARYT